MESVLASGFLCIDDGFELILYLLTAGITDSQHHGQQFMSVCLSISLCRT